MKNILILFLLSGLFNINASAQAKKPVAKPVVKPKPGVLVPTAAAGAARGKAVYLEYCVACHQADGAGVADLNPPIIKSPYVLGDKSRLISTILKGMQGVEINGKSYSNVMPPHNFLTDQQIADILTYARTGFGNKASMVSPAEVKAVRAKTK